MEMMNITAEYLETLSPEEVMALKAPPKLDHLLYQLVEKSRENRWTEADQRFWDRFEEIDHLVHIAKIQADQVLKRRVASAS